MSSSSESQQDRSPTRLLLLAKGLGLGGAERLLVSGAARLDRSSFEVEVAYLLPWKNALVPEFERLDVPVHCLGGGRAAGVSWVHHLRRLVRLGRFDLVHTHTPYVAVGARMLPSPHVRVVH